MHRLTLQSPQNVTAMARCSDSCSAPGTREAEEETEWVAGQSGLKTKTVSRRPVRQGLRERKEEELTQTKRRQKMGVEGAVLPPPSAATRTNVKNRVLRKSTVFFFPLNSPLGLKLFPEEGLENTGETRLIGANVTHQIT